MSDRRRRGPWSARGTLELLPGVERKSGAAVRSTDFVGRHQAYPPTSPFIESSGSICPDTAPYRPSASFIKNIKYRFVSFGSKETKRARPRIAAFFGSAGA